MAIGLWESVNGTHIYEKVSDRCSASHCTIVVDNVYDIFRPREGYLDLLQTIFSPRSLEVYGYG